ncbi:MAG: maleylpyruvate isomerase family mycothiol-dependent enzyme [Micromonosporaceae bacterium]|nr:maleylpyruvate isomerase family mycothiol-dependent enzyme [Micromonosporaceae bacterium]
METSRYLSCLRHDAARLRTVAEGHLDDRVPSCPEWTVADLVRHVAVVYQHKTHCIRLGEKPQPWPPDLSKEEPLALLESSLADLLKEFEAHEPTDHVWTWYPPDQSVGFWIRRMAQETVIHRVDAELAAGEVTAAPDDLAVDGIDEVLSIFLGWDSFDTLERAGPGEWPGLESADGQVVRIAAGGDAWSVRPTPAGLEVSSGGTDEAAAVVTGEPVDVLLWLWRRGDDHRLSVAGDRNLVEFLHAQMAHATQ